MLTPIAWCQQMQQRHPDEEICPGVVNSEKEGNHVAYHRHGSFQSAYPWIYRQRTNAMAGFAEL